jgi:hypothetical protein
MQRASVVQHGIQRSQSGTRQECSTKLGSIMAEVVVEVEPSTIVAAITRSGRTSQFATR